jgi:formylglycine-generating enzyme required for sulfatase activity
MKKVIALIFCFMMFSASAFASRSPAPVGMILVEGGTFMMGSPSSEPGRNQREGPQHSVTVSSFWMGKYPVTQAEWVEVMGGNPSYFRNNANSPVENVSWFRAIEYCNLRSVRAGLTPVYTISGTNVTWDRNANGYRLPTEAEWEFAARGGNKAGSGFIYSGSNNIDDVAWFNGNSGDSTHPVGSKKPNQLGIHDMNGNVLEWLWAWFGSYTDEEKTNPIGPNSGTGRVLRGGSWSSSMEHVRISARSGLEPTLRSTSFGFRVVRNNVENAR